MAVKYVKVIDKNGTVKEIQEKDLADYIALGYTEYKENDYSSYSGKPYSRA